MKALATAAVLSVEALARLFNLPAREVERKIVPARSPLKLHGTLVAQDERYSLALVEGRTVAVGDRIGGATVRSISKGCVVLDAIAPQGAPGGSEEHCMQPRAAAEPTSSTGGPLLHAKLSDFAEWGTARIVPTPKGLKLLAVPKIAQALGVQPGDLLTKVNGKPVDFSALALVRPGAVLSVELERNGQPFTLEGQLDP